METERPTNAEVEAALCCIAGSQLGRSYSLIALFFRILILMLALQSVRTLH